MFLDIKGANTDTEKVVADKDTLAAVEMPTGKLVAKTREDAEIVIKLKVVCVRNVTCSFVLREIKGHTKVAELQKISLYLGTHCFAKMCLPTSEAIKNS